MKTDTLDFGAARTALAAHHQTYEMFSRRLIEHNRVMNLTRIDSPEQIRIRHFLDSLAALPVLDEVAASNKMADFSLIDVGSGAGFPALALAIARPQWRIVSLEATDKKVHFQRQVCTELGLTNVQVVHGRAEVMAHEAMFREQFTVAVARAVAGLEVLAELMMAFVRPKGIGLFWKGSQCQEEINSAAGAFEKMGASITQLSSYPLPQQSSADITMYLIAAKKQTPAPQAYPRRNYGAIRNHPLH